MRKISDIDDGTSKNVIHCKNKAEADLICNMLHDMGKTWESGASYLNNSGYREEEGGSCYNPGFGIKYDYNYYKHYCPTKIKIYKASDFLPRKSLLSWLGL